MAFLQPNEHPAAHGAAASAAALARGVRRFRCPWHSQRPVALSSSGRLLASPLPHYDRRRLLPQTFWSFAASVALLPGLRHSARGKRWQQMGRRVMANSGFQESFASLSLEQLASALGSMTHAKYVWKMLRQGQDPFSELGQMSNSAHAKLRELDPGGVFAAALSPDAVEAVASSQAQDKTQEDIQTTKLETEHRPAYVNLEGVVQAELGAESCTTKLLLRLWDGQAVETVLIPQSARNSKKRSSTTLCISSQVGCAQGCRFCATAAMGIVRDLSPDEILAQVVQGRRYASALGLPVVTHIVFMGMGDALANLPALLPVVGALTDSHRMAISRRKVCVSSVAPSPEHVHSLAGLRCQLAWSLHTADDTLRRQLVPSARFPVSQLRDAFAKVLHESDGVHPDHRILVAVVLIEGVNDSIAHAVQVAEFLKPWYEDTIIQVAINLIPYNETGRSSFRRPSEDAVRSYRDAIFEVLPSIFITIRHARGDDASAACGQLATARREPVAI